MILRAASLFVLGTLLFCGAPASAQGGRTAAVLPAEMNDPGLAYGRKPVPADQKRLVLITDQLRQSLAEKANIASVDLGPQTGEMAKQAPFYKCTDCAAPIAKALGADLAVTTTVEKGAGQIFNLTVTIVEADGGKLVRNGLVVIRANTDDDWTHAMRWVVKNRLLAEPLPGRS